MQHTFQYVKQYKAICKNSFFQVLPVAAAFVTTTATSFLGASRTLLLGLCAAIPSGARHFIYQTVRTDASR